MKSLNLIFINSVWLLDLAYVINKRNGLDNLHKYICFIPARAGSKRIPKKNILDLNSKPLIMHSIDFALKVFKREEIYVSSDSKKIQEIARKESVNIHLRPAEMARDETSMLETTIDFIKNKNISHDTNIVLLQPTNPFRSVEYFLKLKKIFEKSKTASSAISLVRCTFFHPSKIGFICENSKFNLLNIDPENNIDNDKKKPYFVISGSFYIVKVKNLIANKSFIGESPVGLEESFKNFCNIDTPVDFKIAEMLVAKKNI